MSDPIFSVNIKFSFTRSFLPFPFIFEFNFADRCAPCRLELRQLIYRKQEQHAASMRAQHWVDNMGWQAGNYEEFSFNKSYIYTLVTQNGSVFE